MRKTPIRRSLQRPPTFMGVSPQLAAINFTLTGIFMFAMQIWYFIFVSVVLHFIFKMLTNRDPYLVLVIEKFRAQGEVYEPFPLKHHNTNSLRPKGWGRDEVF
jgi:type IV secretory pathway VirB3-like protein